MANVPVLGSNRDIQNTVKWFSLTYLSSSMLRFLLETNLLLSLCLVLTS